MKYEKPEINVLGDASRLIEVIPRKSNTLGDEGHDAPAYDLDE